MTNTQPTTETQATVELRPSYNLSVGLIAIAIAISFFQIWVGGVIAILGLFLLVQTATIRLQFTDTALDVCRSGKLLRRFPYSDWLAWRIFWQPVPILFYFREVKSIHFLPILFDSRMLVSCLEKYCPLKQ
ncbi:hypothetical protein Sta7437_3145 [Stanieria cyanosphaera PCC 7437]|uniref:Uncharacterized protein n=1 Tax=Stanieria cyanosphaera (strain ATCC 29371 / PCC 7437) TaxID=111780 RepID=K9XX65_STAC7|nr:DUF3119 family protein [Stanieria cyanosphaera]AFZ36654.1 hypothetical protein Sta7437_3145 [Stanieria cyanosphaera PCC 7437]